jgi:hypothetical protein
MNPTRFEELLLAHEDDTLTPAELTEFKHLLATHSEARQRLVETALLQNTASTHTLSHRTPAAPTRWLTLRPLIAATAAGIVLGCFSTSLVMAFTDGLRKVLLPLANPGFELPQSLPQTHLAPIANQWSGLDTEIVPSGGPRPPARSGQRMLRLGPAPEGKGYFANLLTDLTTTRPLTSKPLQIEITAHFHASKPRQNEHYSFNAATFAESPAIVSTLWENTWRDMRDASLTTTGKALFPTAAQPGWHTLTLRLDVPPQASTLVISLGSNTPGPLAGRTDHFIDDVHASWVINDKTPAP